VSDRIALTLGLIVTAAIFGDIFLNDGRAMLFLLTKFADMVEWLAFWR
jgi:RNA-binding protein YlmH